MLLFEYFQPNREGQIWGLNVAISGEDRCRITYEARQLLHSVYADEDQEIIGTVGKLSQGNGPD